MPKRTVTRRTVLTGAPAAVASLPFATRVLSAAPPAAGITPDLIAAAKKEGRVHWYTAMDLTMSEVYARAFEAKFPGITVKVERSGGERVFSRIAQEYSSKIYNVDMVNTTDSAHTLAWRNNGWLEPYVTDDVAQHWPIEHKNSEGYSATHRIVFSIIGYNTGLVKPADIPKSYTDLLDPKWTGKLVKAHPAYSGATLTATHAIVRALGWEYFEKIAKLKVLQVQSGVDPPKKIALGERAAMIDGADYLLLAAMDKGAPVEAVYAAEGAPIINSPNVLFKAAPNPNAARLLLTWMFSGEGQKTLVDISGLYVPHKQVPAKAGRRPLASIKILAEDPEAMLIEADAIKEKYSSIFKV